MDVIKQISNIGVVPVIAIDDADKAVDLAKALLAGGLPVAEITFRTAAGQQAIENVAKNVPEVLVGAGTVINVEQAKQAVEKGAKFIVSPGFVEEVVDYCLENNIPVLPGTSNATEMVKAVNKGLKFVKFFPAEASGGLSTIKALAPVFPTLNFMPTGGVNTKNFMEYLNYERIFACGGSWMVKKDLINDEKWDEITNICKDVVNTMLGFSIKHVGINTADENQAQEVAKKYSTLFNLEYKPGNSSIFAGKDIECLKKPFLGKNGHICIGTNNVERAIYSLTNKGVEFNEETRGLDEKGKTKNIYIKDEIGGFAIHIMKK